VIVTVLVLQPSDVFNMSKWPNGPGDVQKSPLVFGLSIIRHIVTRDPCYNHVVCFGNRNGWTNPKKSSCNSRKICAPS